MAMCKFRIEFREMCPQTTPQEHHHENIQFNLTMKILQFRASTSQALGKRI